MKKTSLSVIIILTTIFLYLLTAELFIIPNYKAVFYIINFIFWVLLSLILLFIYKIKFNRKRVKYDSIQIIIISIITYYLIYYGIGIISGFLRNSYSLDFISIVKNLFWSFSLIISMEYVRSLLLLKIKRKKVYYVIMVLLFTLAEIIFDLRTSNLNNMVSFFEVFLGTFLPALSKNILLTYMTSKVGCSSAIIYRILIELMIYVLPIFPNIDKYALAIINFIFPFIIIYFLSNVYRKDEQEYLLTKKNPNRIIYLFTIIISFFIVSLVLGIFRYKLIAIASDSMVPSFSRGYGVIYKKIDSNYIANIKENDILVYKTNEAFIVHRVVNIDVNNKRVYTKGDNNKNYDFNPVYPEQFVGIVKIYIPYVGYPSLWFLELLERK